VRALSQAAGEPKNRDGVFTHLIPSCFLKELMEQRSDVNLSFFIVTDKEDKYNGL
jgi:hypothetical protein